MKNIIITDIKYRMAMAPIHELGKKGYKISAVDFCDVPKNERLGHFSKFVKTKETVSPEEKEFVNDIIKLSQKEQPVLLPVNRTSLTYTIKNKDVLKNHCDFTVTDMDTLGCADDKSKICDIAKKVGVPVPKTTNLKEHESIEKMADSVSFPCIIKYRNGEAMGLKPFDRYKIVNNKNDFINAYTKMHETDSFPIASDYITGHDIGVAVVMNKNHKPVDFICYESLREFPIEGGPTCFAKTIFDRNLLKYAVKLLEEIKFSGIAMLDFKGSIENPYFLEINPRIWGSAYLCTVSKSTFFESYVLASCGEKDELDIETCVPTYKLNTKMRFTPQSFLCFISHMRKSQKKFKILKEYLLSLFDFSVKDGLFTFSDMKPYLMYIKNLIKH